jgi:hypothetical protein
MIRLALLLLVLAGPAASETARVLTGEHGEFTRLVIELPDAPDWSLGRTATGYGFAAGQEKQPAYDLAGVWQRIDRARLGALDVDPATGALQLTLACSCHIFPFEYQPGVVVLDIRPGAAPVGSAFEADFLPPGAGTASLSGPLTPTAQGVSQPGYNWLASGPGLRSAPVTKALPLPLDTGSVSLVPLRDALLQELARGAAEGLVDMDLPIGADPAAVDALGSLPWTSIRIGEAPGLVVTEPGALIETMPPTASCTPDSLLDLAAWGEGKSPMDLIAEARSGLYGEFDAPDEEAVLRSIRQLLYLGFGAEAQQHASFLTDAAAGEDLGVYRSLARIIDGDSDPQTPFAAMLDCDGVAALWAALARDRLPFGPGVKREAILRGFLGLPPHLRRHLGPPLAEKFLALADADAARMIRDAIERAPAAEPAEVALLDATARLQDGDTEAAIAHAETAIALAGDDVDALVTVVETHLPELTPLGPEVAEALQALQGETRGTAEQQALDRARVLALALSGQTAAAFADEAATGDVLADLWRVAQVRSPDDDFLRHAVIPDAAPPPGVAQDVSLGVARRLLDLGFPDAALAWTGPVGPGDALEARLVAAQAEQARGGAAAALGLLDGLDGPEAEALRAAALLQLGDIAAAGTALIAAGQPEEAARLGLWATDWSQPAKTLPAPWQDAAAQAVPTDPAAEAGLLARGTALAARGEDTRAAVEALLAAVPSPPES